MYETKAKEIVKTLTLEEKASLTSGAEMFATSCLEEKGIASVFMSDGPHGLRKQEGKQDGYKKLQADPWNFPERIFVVEDRKMVCVR